VRSEIAVVVTAFEEADRLADTLRALDDGFPRARVIVADDASTDQTAEVARSEGAEVVTAPERLGKGGVATLAVERLRETGAATPTLVLCDGDLGASARHLPALVEVIERGAGDLAVAVFEKRVGGGFGLAVGFARGAIRELTGLKLDAPISGQRALAPAVVDAVVPFAPRFGMEIGMTVDAHRAGFRVVEVELPLEHRATGRTAAGFAHRARQLRDFIRVYASRRMGVKRTRRARRAEGTDR
jgi:glycosyltransferase involved in cell wall biosynthesis